MYFGKEMLEKWNEELREDLKNEDLDHALFYAPEKSKKVSVIATYRPLNGEGFYRGLDENLQEVVLPLQGDNFQYGISTDISAEKIVQAISELAFQDGEGLESFLKQNHDCYKFHASQAGFLLAMAKFLTLNLTYNYCLKIKSDGGAALHEKFGSEVEYDEKTGVCSLIGNPSRELIEALSSKKFDIRGGIAYETQGSGRPIREIYKEGSIITLHKVKLFYSGALIRPLEIAEEESYVSNHGVKVLNIYFEKSSYGTVNAFDCDRAKFHRLISEKDREIIERFFSEEDKITQKLSQRSGEGTLEKINAYLRESANVHQIVVSANIESSDGILLMPLRGKGVPDEKISQRECVYPGVNGNAEVYVPRIGFYGKSSYEDLPCIRVDRAERIDFSGELTRETYAELKLSPDPISWELYGISMSGKICSGNVAGNVPAERRMHFNVLAYRKVPQTFSQICQLQRAATEDYEIKKLMGIKVVRYNSPFAFVRDLIVRSLEFLRRNGDILTSVLSLLVFFVSMGAMNFETVDGIVNIITAAVAALLILSSVINIFGRICRYGQEKKCIEKYFFFQDKEMKKRNAVLRGLLKRYIFHPATYVLFKLFFIQDDFRAEEIGGQGQEAGRTRRKRGRP